MNSFNTLNTIAKKIVAIIILFLIILIVGVCSESVTHATQIYEQTNIENTYDISEASELKDFAKNVNEGLYDGYYGMTVRLTADINLNDELWNPIGTDEYPFKGTFIGNGYSISGLNIDINENETYKAGFFGRVEKGASVSGISIYGRVHGASYTASVVAYNSGNINNCFNYAEISAVNGSINIGGIAGYNDGEITGCGNYGNVQGDFISILGGVAGTNAGTCTECFNAGNVSSIDAISGGIVGQNAEKGKVVQTFNRASVKGKSDVGGISGINFGDICDSYASGTIIADVGNAGGISGSNESSGTIQKVYTVSENISGRANIAAIAGINRGIVSKCFYSEDIFKGALVNGVDSSESFAVGKSSMLHSDALTNNKKLAGLTDGSPDVWVKRNSDEINAYYPELKCFSDSFEDLSVSSVSVARLTVSDEEICLNEDSFLYDGKEKTVQLIYRGVVLTEGEDYTVEYVNNINAGKATAKIKFLNMLRGDVVKDFYVEKRKVEIQWVENDYIYNGSFQAPCAVVSSGVIDGEEVTFDYICDDGIVAGIHKITARLSQTNINDNYILDEQSKEYFIAKKPINVTWSEKPLVYNGLAQMPEIIYIEGVVDGDQITFSYDYSSNINAGDYSVAVDMKDTIVNSNYAFEKQEVNYVIGKRPLSVILEQDKLIYNGQVQYPEAIIQDGQVGEEKITFVYGAYENNINADEEEGYYVSVELEQTTVNDNYQFEKQQYHYYIYKRTLTLEWWNTPLIYNGRGQYPGFYITSGRLGADEPEFNVSDYSGNSQADTDYTVTVTLSESDANANYTITPQIKEYVIQKAVFDLSKIKFEDKVFAYDGEYKSITIEGELPTGVKVVYENNYVSEIGAHTVTARFSVDENNYFPIEKESLNATVFIAKTEFSFNEGVNLKIEGMPVFGLNVEITNSENQSKFEKLGTSVLRNYIVGKRDYSGAVSISVPLNNEEAAMSGLHVIYIDSTGGRFYPEINLNGNVLTFTAEDVVEFAVIADTDYTIPVTIFCCIVIVISLLSVVAAVVVRRKRIASEAVENLNEEKTLRPIDELLCSSYTENNDKGNIVGSDNSNIKEKNLQSDEIQQTEEPFTLDGIKCLSYEWFLRSLTVRDENKQVAICRGDGEAFRLKESIPKNSVFWCGKRYKKNSIEYCELLEKAKRSSNEKKY